LVWHDLGNKKKLVEGITKVLEEIGIPKEATTVVICEEPKENWATGGKLHSERFANIGPQPQNSNSNSHFKQGGKSFPDTTIRLPSSHGRFSKWFLIAFAN
jgi:4-oxalocrotonate tautomerase family enzyme